MSHHRHCCCGTLSCPGCSTDRTETARVTVTGNVLCDCVVNYHPTPPLNPDYDVIRGGDGNGTFDLALISSSATLCVWAVDTDMYRVHRAGDECDPDKPINPDTEEDADYQISVVLKLGINGSNKYRELTIGGQDALLFYSYGETATTFNCDDEEIGGLEFGTQLTDCTDTSVYATGGVAVVAWI